MTYPHDDDRDRERDAWNDALASGDPDRIEQTKTALLDGIFRRTMDDEPNYSEAGWQPTGSGLVRPTTRHPHQHRAAPAKRVTRGWTECVVSYWHDQAAHGNVTYIDECSCGATRRSEVNGHVRQYGPWKDAR